MDKNLTNNQQIVLNSLEKSDQPLGAYSILFNIQQKGIKSPQQVYAEKPFNLKILKTDIDKYMESDDELVKLKSKVEYIQTVIDFLDRTIKSISNRGFQIKNAIDWRKFTSGAI